MWVSWCYERSIADCCVSYNCCMSTLLICVLLEWHGVRSTNREPAVCHSGSPGRANRQLHWSWIWLHCPSYHWSVCLCLPVNHILSLLPLVSQTTVSASQSIITFLCLAPPTKRNDSHVNYVLNPSFSSIWWNNFLISWWWLHTSGGKSLSLSFSVLYNSEPDPRFPVLSEFMRTRALVCTKTDVTTTRIHTIWRVYFQA